MARILTLCALAAAFAALALAETWNGRLVDATCYEQQKGAATCNPTSTTTSFALLTSTQVLRLDDNGNAKAAAAIRDRAERSADPNQMQTSECTAKIMGTKSGDVLNVEKIDVK
jgi:hypothetical protein